MAGKPPRIPPLALVRAINTVRAGVQRANRALAPGAINSNCRIWPEQSSSDIGLLIDLEILVAVGGKERTHAGRICWAGPGSG